MTRRTRSALRRTGPMLLRTGPEPRRTGPEPRRTGKALRRTGPMLAAGLMTALLLPSAQAGAAGTGPDKAAGRSAAPAGHGAGGPSRGHPLRARITGTPIPGTTAG